MRHFFLFTLIFTLALYPVRALNASPEKSKKAEAAEKIYTYSGPKVKLKAYINKGDGNKAHKFKSEYIGDLQGRQGKGFSYQGMDIYKNYLVSCQNQGVATIYLIEKGRINKISQFELASFHKYNHVNVACFSKEFYDKKDPMPLLYISHTHKKPINGQKDLLFVERISEDLNSSELVQTIFFDDTDNLFGYALQWVIDNENGFLYGYGNTINNTDPENKHRIIKFNLPALDTGRSVVLRKEDALENYLIEEVSSHRANPIGQGLCISGGKLYMPTGFGKDEQPSILYVWDLKSRCMSNIIDLTKATSEELEDCAVYRKSLVLQTQKGLFKLSF